MLLVSKASEACKKVNHPMGTVGTEAAPSTVQVRTTVFVLVFVHLTITWLAPSAVLAPDMIELIKAFFLGLVISQMTLLAVWLAYGSDRFIRRLLSVCVLTVFALFAALVGTQAIGDDFAAANSPVDVLIGGILFVVSIAVMQVPFWFVGRFWEKWELVAPWTEDQPRPASKQFNLRFMIGLTTTLALALSIGRLLIPPDALSTLRTAVVGEMLGVIATWAVFLSVNLIVVLPCVWRAFSDRSIGLIVAAWILLLVFVVFVEALYMAPFNTYGFFLTPFVVTVAQVGSMFISLRVLRHVEFRLVTTESQR